MSIGNATLLGLLIVIGIYGVMLYNGLVACKHAVAKAWANIDVLLKQRHDELPKLVEVCKQYKQFEQETLQRVIEARAAVHSAREAGNVGALGKAEGSLRSGLGRLFAIAEAYPELKTNEHFMQLQQRISSLRAVSPTGASCTTRRSISTTSASNSFRIHSLPACLVSSSVPCWSFQQRKRRMWMFVSCFPDLLRQA